MAEGQKTGAFKKTIKKIKKFFGLKTKRGSNPAAGQRQGPTGQ